MADSLGREEKLEVAKSKSIDDRIVTALRDAEGRGVFWRTVAELHHTHGLLSRKSGEISGACERLVAKGDLVRRHSLGAVPVAYRLASKLMSVSLGLADE